MLVRAGHQGRVSETIVHRIKTQITPGRLVAGHKLTAEREMARQFKTSHVSVREAYRSLEELGVLRCLLVFASVSCLQRTTNRRRPTMRTKLTVYVGLLAVLVFFSVTAIGADMLAGTWKLNVAKSKYSPGPAPQSNTIKFESVAGGIKLVADGLDSQGRKTHNEYTAKFDGTDSPTKPMLDGKPNPNAADAVSYKKIDDYTYEVTAKLKGKTLNVARHVISKDGKTRTVTTSGTNAQGQKLNDTTVFEKQ
jgi:DNA-binding transcriptional regulator YhcF (GntR family)